jgi:hypothetical protein
MMLKDVNNKYHTEYTLKKVRDDSSFTYNTQCQDKIQKCVNIPDRNILVGDLQVNISYSTSQIELKMAAVIQNTSPQHISL